MRFLKPAAVAALALALASLVSVGAPAVGATSTSPTPTITLFSDGLAAGSEPVSITAGPEAALWLGLRGSQAVGRMSLQGGASDFSAPSQVGAVAAGPEGDVWFIETSANPKLGKLDPSSSLVSEYSLPANAKLSDLAFGPERRLWVVGEKGSEAYVWRVNPATGSFEGEYRIPTNGAKPLAAVFGREGDLWFTESANPGQVGKLEPSTGLISEFKGSNSNTTPTGIAVGPEGDIFWTENTEGAIGRINPGSGQVSEFTVGGKPDEITAGPDGALYFTNTAGGIGRITPEGQSTEFTNGLEKTEPVGITVGPDGNIWFTVKNNPGRVGRLTVVPGVACVGAEQIGATTATLAASLQSRSQEISYLFEYGTTSSYGAATSRQMLAPSAAAATVTAAVAGLRPSTTYHFRLLASNATGTTYGSDCAFTTTAQSTPPPEGHTVAKVTEEVQLGRVAGAAPTSGTVLVENSSGKFVPLTSPRTIPIGATIEATHGTVSVITALPKKGSTQSVSVWGGRFKLAQAVHGNGLTKIILAGARPSCPKHGLAQTAKKKARQRKLWAEDHHGRYSTYGANSVATVLGTKWETVDSCAGTLTRVFKGRVKVRDTHTHKHATISAGHSFLARP